MSLLRTTAILCAGATLAACSFFGKQPPLHPRYFEAEPSLPAQKAQTGGPALRLGHVVGSSHLRELIAYHVSEHELGFYEQRRWTERPENYLRRALSAALFEQRGFSNTVSGVVPTLEVELTDFSELREPEHAARVRVRVVLVDQRTVKLERSFEAQEAVAKGDDFGLVPAALTRALERCVGQVADAVQAQLGARAE